MSNSIKTGDKIPSFELKDDQGELVSISAESGQPMVIYFYPRDETINCIKEACSFRDSHEEFSDAGVKVLGISSDGVGSHAAFKKNHNLPFTLLSDKGGKVSSLFGVPKSLFGLIPGRVTYVIDGRGVVRHIISSHLNPSKHIKDALEVIKSFG